MNEQWKSFLEARPGSAGGAGERPGAHPDCALFDLSHLGIISVRGEDAQSFLQGQITNDTARVTADQSLLAASCNPKGRMLASFRLFRRDDAICLQMPAELIEGVLKRLRMFVLRSRVELSDVSDRWVRIGLAGDCAPALLEAQLGEVPEGPDRVAQHAELTCIRLPGETPRFELIGPVEAMQALWEALERSAAPSDAGHWALLDIRAGLPTVLPGTAEAFVPQMANMQLVNGISFKKGCYTGQEVVARMQYLGKLKRRMYLAHVEADRPPAPGDELFAAGSASGQGAGKVVDAQPAPGGGCDLLAVVEIASAESGDVRVGDPDGPRLSFLSLPYDFDAA